jgi:hypothetical protein
MQRTAQVQQRPLQQLLFDAMVTGLRLLDDLPPEMVDEMAAMALLNDAALWRVARHTLPPDRQEQLDTLLYKKGRDELSAEKARVLDELLAEYEHIILTRAHAAVLLQQRGYDVSDPSEIFDGPVA